MTALLLGANGQVGHELVGALSPLGPLIAADRARIDLQDLDAVEAALEQIRPALVVNAAAYTAVDRAESEPELARRINAEAPGVLARWCAAHGSALVHYSTDYVFDGSADRPLRESDPVAPLGVYGRTKEAGEVAIRESGCAHLILRTSWVYGARGHNFLRSILGHARVRDELTIVDDQWGSPTWSGALAASTAAALQRLGPPADWAGRIGTYHLSSRGRTTWCGFARRFCDRAADLGLIERAPRIRAISTEDWPTPARRPAFSVLDNDRFQTTFELEVTPWETQLDDCLALMTPGDLD